MGTKFTRLSAWALCGLAVVLSSASLAQTATKTQNVNVVNTPTVNVAAGGPIGVDVLTLPTSPIKTVEILKSVSAVVDVPCCSSSAKVGYTYTPPAGKRVIIKSLLVSAPIRTEDANGVPYVHPQFFSLVYSGGWQTLNAELNSVTASLSISDATIALPAGPFKIEWYYPTTPGYDQVAHVLITLQETDE